MTIAGGIMPPDDLSDLLARVQVKRFKAAHYCPDIDLRLIQWGAAVVEKSGNGAVLRSGRWERSGPGRWWVIRALLPDEALPVLERKLDELISSLAPDRG